MATELQRTDRSEPSHWRLFLFVVLLMGSITAASITLIMMANPSRDTMHAPAVEPVSQMNFQSLDHQNAVELL